MNIMFLFTPSENPLLLNSITNNRTNIAYIWLASNLQLMESVKIYGILVKGYSDQEAIDDVIVDLITNDPLSKRILEYLNINPLTNLSVDRISILFIEGSSYRESSEISPFTHKYVKSTAYISENVINRPDIRRIHCVSEIALYALTSGVDRFGTTIKYIALQFAFIEDILRTLLKRFKLHNSGEVLDKLLVLSPYKGNNGHCSIVDKIVSTIAIAAGFTKTLRAPLATRAAQTTAVWSIRPDEEDKVKLEVNRIFTILYENLPEHISCRNSLSGELEKLIYVAEVDGRLKLFLSSNSSDTHAYSLENLSAKALGRINSVLNTLEWLYSKVHGENDNTVLGDIVVFEWSEQMGPIDIALLLALYSTLNIPLPKTIWIIATPLTLPHAVLGKAYIDYIKRSIGNIRKSKILLSSGVDKHVIKSTIEYMLRKKDKDSMITYIAGGSTLHTTIASLMLHRKDTKVISWTRPRTS